MTNNTQPQDTGAVPTISDIVYKLHAKAFLDGALPNMDYPKEAIAQLEALMQQYAQKYADEVIGGDEVIESMDADWALVETARQMNGAKPYHLKQARNLHRASQRQRNQEMEGKRNG